MTKPKPFTKRKHLSFERTGFTIDGRTLWVSRDGLRIGDRGQTRSASEVYGILDKGNARKLRQKLYAMGYSCHAFLNREKGKLEFCNLAEAE